jgi:hypothetical protein
LRGAELADMGELDATAGKGRSIMAGAFEDGWFDGARVRGNQPAANEQQQSQQDTYCERYPTVHYGNFFNLRQSVPVATSGNFAQPEAGAKNGDKSVWL